MLQGKCAYEWPSLQGTNREVCYNTHHTLWFLPSAWWTQTISPMKHGPEERWYFATHFNTLKRAMDTQMSCWLQHNWSWQWLCHPPTRHWDTKSTTHFSSLAMNLNTILAAQLTAVSDVKHGKHHFLSYQTNQPIAQAYIHAYCGKSSLLFTCWLYTYYVHDILLKENITKILMLRDYVS